MTKDTFSDILYHMIKKLKVTSIIFISILLGFSSLCFAQNLNIESADQETHRSMLEEIEEKLRAPVRDLPDVEIDEKKDVPTGPSFFVKEIQLAGTETFPPEKFDHIVEKYENKDTNLLELNDLAKKIQREYLRAGIITACFLPPQEVEDGIVTLQVVESKMGLLNIAEHKYFNNDRLKYYWRTKQGEVLRYDEITRNIHFINKNPDREARVTLHAGEKPHTTDVRLDVETKLPLHLNSSIDNDGGITSGMWRNGFGGRCNNFLGLDDTLLAGYKYGKHFEVPYFYHSIPITNYGTSILYGYSYSKSFPKKQFEPYAIDSRSRNSSIAIYQDIFKGSEYAGDVNFGLDFKDKSVKYTGGTLYKDRLRVVKFGANVLHRDRNSITYISPQISKGINFWGSRRVNDFSTRGAENTFWKFNLGVKHRLNLPRKTKMSLKIASQLASEKLASQEEVSLGGINSVRGYPPADYLADNAIQANLEFLIPAFFLPKNIKIPYGGRSIQDDITLVLFADGGYGKKIDAEGGEKKDARLIGLGCGFRIKLPNQAILRLEWGFPMPIADEPATEQSNSRFHFSLDISDMLPGAK